jgi:transcriptional regulator with XRE-family HTH domain
MFTFAEFLRQHRLSRNLTMQELAVEVNVSAQFISLLESGKRRPSDKLVRRCAEFFAQDVHYVRFLAQPIPVAQKRALLESPSAPDYIPRSMRAQVFVQDSEDVLIQNLLSGANVPTPETDTPFHFLEPTSVTRETLALPLQIVAQIRDNPERFTQKARAWAGFYAAYFRRHVEGREASTPDFEAAHARLREETTAAYPPKLRYLVCLHLGVCRQEQGDAESARRLYYEAHEHAVEMSDPAGVSAALWLAAALARDAGDTFTMMDTLDKALAVEGIPPFAIARCLSDAVDGHLALWQNERVLERVADALKLWRSSTLEAAQEQKSVQLVRTEIAALEATVRMGRDDDARTWLNRVRAITFRIPMPPSDSARVLMATAGLMHDKARVNQARDRCDEVMRMDLGATDAGRAARHAAAALISALALEMGHYGEAENVVEAAWNEPPMAGPVGELTRKGVLGIARCRAQLAVGRRDAAYETLRSVEDAIAHAVSEEPRLADTPLLAHIRSQVDDWRRRLAQPAEEKV